MRPALLAVGLVAALLTARAPAQEAEPAAEPPPPPPAEPSLDSSPSESSEASHPLEINGFARADAFVPTKRDKDPFNFLGATFMLKVAPSFGDKAAALAEARLIADEVTREVRLDLREVYVDLYLGPVDIRLGRQIIAWGRADGFNPTDNLCGKDMTVFSPEEDDRRMGATALKIDLRLDPVKLTGVVIPAFRPSVLLLGDFPPPNVSMVDPAVPEPDVRHIGGALRLDVSLSSIDFSVSYFNGYGTFPGIEIAQVTIAPPGPPLIDLRFTYDRRQVFGLDFAWQVFGLFILRGEGAYVLTDYEEGQTPQIEQSHVYYVLGLEATPVEGLSLIVQFIQKIIPGYQPAGEYLDPFLLEVASKNNLYHRQQRSHLESLSARIAYTFLQDAMRIELLAVYDFQEEDYLIRPLISYAFNDALSGVLGAEIYEGPDDSLFGQLDDYSSVFLELKYSF